MDHKSTALCACATNSSIIKTCIYVTSDGPPKTKSMHFMPPTHSPPPLNIHTWLPPRISKTQAPFGSSPLDCPLSKLSPYPKYERSY